MLARKNSRKLRAKQKNQAGNITPGQHRYHGPHGTVYLVIVEIVQAPGKNILCRFPQETTDHCSRQCIAQRYFGFGHETINQNEERNGHEDTDDCEHKLEQSASEDREQGVTFKLSW